MTHLPAGLAAIGVRVDCKYISILGDKTSTSIIICCRQTIVSPQLNYAQANKSHPLRLMEGTYAITSSGCEVCLDGIGKRFRENIVSLSMGWLKNSQ